MVQAYCAVIAEAPDREKFVFVFETRWQAEDWIRRNPKDEREHMQLIPWARLSQTAGWKGNQPKPSQTHLRSTEWTHPKYPGLTIHRAGYLRELKAYTIEGMPKAGRFRTILEAKLYVLEHWKGGTT